MIIITTESEDNFKIQGLLALEVASCQERRSLGWKEKDQQLKMKRRRQNAYKILFILCGKYIQSQVCTQGDNAFLMPIMVPDSGYDTIFRPISEIQHKYLHNFCTTQHLQSYVQLLWQVCKVGITWGKWGGWSRWGWGWGWGVKRMQIAEFGRWQWGRCWLFNNQLPTIRCWLFNSILILTSSHQILTFVQSDLLIHSIWETLWGEGFVWYGRWKYKIYTKYRNSKY